MKTMKILEKDSELHECVLLNYLCFCLMKEEQLDLQIAQMFNEATEVILNDPVHLELPEDIYVFGNIEGNYMSVFFYQLDFFTKD